MNVYNYAIELVATGLRLNATTMAINKNVQL